MASPGLAGALGAFSQEAWARNAAAYETIRSMPFNAELAAGTLPQDRFRHYIVQDAHYLIGFGRALSLAAAKAPDPDTIVQFSRAAQEAIVVERALHGGFFRDYGIGPETFAATPLTPACDHYVCYLMATAYAEPYAVLCAALLPCFWIYKAVGDDIFARAAPDNPYRAWIDTYAGDEFAAAVARHDRRHRPRGAGRVGGRARADAPGLHAGHPARVAVLGQRLPRRGLDPVSRPARP